MSTSSTPASRSTKAFLDELHALVSEAEKLAEAPVSEHASDVFESLRDRYEAAQARAGELYACTRKKVVARAHQADDAIRANPYQSLAIAVGAGLLAGFLLGRRDR